MHILIEECINEYLNSDKILSWKEFLTHDEYYNNFPKSNTFNLVILYEKNRKILYNVFHRKDNFEEKNDKYLKLFDNPKDLTSKLLTNNYYPKENKNHIIKLLGNKFSDLVVDSIIKYLVKIEINIYNLDRRQNGDSIIFGSEHNDNFVLNVK